SFSAIVPNPNRRAPIGRYLHRAHVTHTSPPPPYPAQRARVDLDHAARNAHAVGNELLGERRRRAAVLQPVLVAVPWAGHAAVDDASLAERPILVGAKIGECPDLRAVAEDCDAFAVWRSDNARTFVRDRERRPDREPAVAAAGAGAVARPLAPAGDEMEQRH